MFYCDACGKKKKWSVSLAKSNGRCEVCGEMSECNDVLSPRLPEPTPKLHNDLGSEVPPYFENPDFERFHRD